jgi:two-component SAPR family response regulator
MKRLTILVSDGENLSELIENPEVDNKLKVDLQKILNYVEINPESDFKIPLLENFRSQHGPTQEKIDKVQFTSRLTRQEYALAKLLIDQAGALINREEMIKAVWPKNLYETSEHALDQMIHRLRLKLEAATPACHLLTYRGRGCKLTIN